MERPSVEIPSGIRRACSSLAAGVTAETPGVYAVGSWKGRAITVVPDQVQKIAKRPSLTIFLDA